MKIFIKIIYTISMAMLWGLHLYGQTVNNVKLLDLTGNTYSSGSSFFVNIGSQMQVTSDYTFECWLYVDTKTSGNYPVIMDRRTVFSFYLGDNLSGSSGDYGVLFATRDISDNITDKIRNDGKSGASYIEMDFDEWYHVAVSSDGTKIRLFINGQCIDSSNTSPNFILSTPSGKPVNYGARYWGSYERFIRGAFDEMRYSDVGRYSYDFPISINTPPHDTTGDPNTILLFNFDDGNLHNSTSANSYTATIHNAPLSYMPWDGFPSDKLPLPIEYYKPLTVRKNTIGHIILEWATATEKNNRGFIIERSVDAQNWENIGFHGGAGNSNVIREYSFTDKKPLNNAYYRLKQFDYDGNSNTSNVVYISIEVLPEISISPNPAKNTLFINGIRTNTNIKAIIYNSTGEQVLEAIEKTNTIDISKLSSGIYFITIEQKGKRDILKFMKN